MTKGERTRPFRRAVTMVAGANGAAQLLSFAAAPVLTRLYAPDDYGALAVFAALLGMLTIVSTLRYEYAIPLADDDRDAGAVAVVALGASIAVAAGTALALWVVSAMGPWTVLAPLSGLWWLLPPAVLTSAVVVVLTQWNLRQRVYGRVAASRLADAVTTLSAQLASGATSPGPAGLLGGSVAGTVLGAGVLLKATFRTLRKAWDGLSWRVVWGLASRYRRFPWVAAPSGFANAASAQVPALFIASRYGAVGAGLFLLPHRILGTPMRTVGDALQQVYTGEAGTLARSDPVEMRRLYVSLLRRVLLVALPIAVVLALMAPFAVPIIFGDAWETSGRLLAALAVPFAIDLAAGPLSVSLLLLERQELQLLADLFRLALVLVVFVLGPVFDLSLLDITIGYGVCIVLSHLFQVWLCLRSFEGVLAR